MERFEGTFEGLTESLFRNGAAKRTTEQISNGYRLYDDKFILINGLRIDSFVSLKIVQMSI